jgi:hypothetical protein
MATKPQGVGAGAERRRHPRKNIIENRLLTVDVSLGREETQGRWQRGIVIDLSEGGMAVQPFLPLKPGTVGEVCLELPGEIRPISGTGIVAWVGQGGRTGIRFIDVPEGARHHLREWLNLRPRDATSPQSATLSFASGNIAPAPNAGLDTDELDFYAALQLIAERAQLISGASGAAVALGDRNGMVCRASSGNAPDIGAELRADSGLSGYCLQTGEIIYCADTHAHPSVDASAARQFDLGSIIVVPVSVAGQLAGLLEVLSPRPHAFDDRLVTRLEHFAVLLSAAIEEHQCGRNSNESAPPVFENKAIPEPASAPEPPEPLPRLSPLPGLAAMLSSSSDPELEKAKLIFDAAVSSLPQAPPGSAAAAAAPAPEAVESENTATPVLETKSAEPDAAPIKTTVSQPLVAPAGWNVCETCGHQNPPWTKSCENCLRPTAQAENAGIQTNTPQLGATGTPTATANDIHAGTAMPAVAPAMDTSEPLAFGSSLSLYAEPSPSASRARKVASFILILIGAFLILAAAVAAGWYARGRYGMPTGIVVTPSPPGTRILPEPPAPVPQHATPADTIAPPQAAAAASSGPAELTMWPERGARKLRPAGTNSRKN